MKPIDKNSKVGWIVHTFGPINPKVYFNHMGNMCRWSKEFNLVFLGIDKHRTADARNMLVEKAREIKCTHILIIDADHMLPKHTLECLSLNNDAPVVSGLVTKRHPPYSQVGFVMKDDGYRPIDLPIDGRSYLVDVCGMGCTLIDVDIFDTLDEPFFFDTLEVDLDGGHYNKRSDTNFFEKVRAKDHKIIVDTRVLIGHMRDEEPIYANGVPDVKQLNKDNKIWSNDKTFDYQMEVYKTAYSIFTESRSCSVIDLGCGNSAKLLTCFKLKYRIVGVDFQEKLLDILKNNFDQNATYFGKDLEEEFNLNETFDMVICADVIEHLTNPIMLLENAKRHMSEDSILVLSSPEKDSIKINNSLHAREFTCDELSAVLLAAGFEIIEKKNYKEINDITYTNNIFVCKLKKKE